MNICTCGKPTDGTLCLRCSALQVLGLHAGATDAEIKSAHRLYVKAWHPDRFPGDEQSKNAAQEKLKEINFAYNFLSFLSSTQSQAARPRATTPPTQPRTGASTPPQPPGWPPLPPKTVPNKGWSLYSALALGLILIAAYILIFRPLDQSRPPTDAASSRTLSAQPDNGSSTRPAQDPKAVELQPSDIDAPSRLALSLPNGTELRKRRHLNGHGELTVENGTQYDAVVHLVDLNSEKTIRTFYVKTGDAFVERQISPGLYGVYFTTGLDWNKDLRTFNSSASYSQFGKNMEFSEKSDPDSGKIEYSTYQITLHQVLGGNTPTYPSDKNAFDKLMNDGTTD
jgi:hypothetical protein